ncbi:MAG: hypothetical protein RL038_294, partial [Actinomycetota bacterium]
MKFEELLRANRPQIEVNYPEFSTLSLTNETSGEMRQIRSQQVNRPYSLVAVAAVAGLLIAGGIVQITFPASTENAGIKWFPGALNPAVGSDNLLSLNPNASQLVVDDREWLFYEINSDEYPEPFQYWHSGEDELISVNPWSDSENTNELSGWTIDELGTTYFGPAWHKTLPELSGDLDSRVRTLYKELVRQANVGAQDSVEAEDTFLFGLKSIIESPLATSDLRVTAIELWNRVPESKGFELEPYQRFNFEGTDLYFRILGRGRYQNFTIVDTNVPGVRQEFKVNCAASGVVVERIWVESVGRTTDKLLLPTKTDLNKLKVI